MRGIKMDKRNIGIATLLLAVFWTAGCQKAQVKKTVDETPVQAQQEDEEASLRNKDYQSIPELTAVHFGYESASLDTDARKTLAKNAKWLRKNKMAEVRIEGHCDERGTTEYNLGLGQRRAAAVRDYYKALGIPGKRMGTISFGREQPACFMQDETCWQRNRRGETLSKRSENKSRSFTFREDS